MKNGVKKNVGEPPPQKKKIKKNNENSELSEMAGTFFLNIFRNFFEIFLYLSKILLNFFQIFSAFCRQFFRNILGVSLGRGNLGFLRAQTREARTSLACASIMLVIFSDHIVYLNLCQIYCL
jgi:hypothetical protein